jgi:acyl carrier protein
MTETDDTNWDAARTLVAIVTERPTQSVPADADISNFPAWDSVAHVRILLEIEARTGKPLDSDQISSIRSLKDVASALLVP